MIRSDDHGTAISDTQARFSVIIPTRGRTQVVEWAIWSALAQTFTDLECVVIDNNLDDRVEKFARSLPIPGWDTPIFASSVEQ